MREMHPTVNTFVPDMKKMLSKSVKQRSLFVMATNLPLPPEPVQTRWGTFMTAAMYYAANHSKVADCVQKMKPTTAAA